MTGVEPVARPRTVLGFCFTWSMKMLAARRLPSSGF